MSADSVRRVAELLRAARERDAASDPDFFRRKAEVFDVIAAEDPEMASRCQEFAVSARRRADELDES